MLFSFQQPDGVVSISKFVVRATCPVPILDLIVFVPLMVAF